MVGVTLSSLSLKTSKCASSALLDTYNLEIFIFFCKDYCERDILIKSVWQLSYLLYYVSNCFSLLYFVHTVFGGPLFKLSIKWYLLWCMASQVKKPNSWMYYLYFAVPSFFALACWLLWVTVGYCDTAVTIASHGQPPLPDVSGHLSHWSLCLLHNDSFSNNVWQIASCLNLVNCGSYRLH